MGNFFICLIISILTSVGMAIVIVEKGKDFPIKQYRVLMQKILHDNIGGKWYQVFYCTTCTSFWTALIGDIVVCIIAFLHGITYFFWPFSGFISAGIAWAIIELLNILDKKQDINILVDNDLNKDI